MVGSCLMVSWTGLVVWTTVGWTTSRSTTGCTRSWTWWWMFSSETVAGPVVVVCSVGSVVAVERNCSCFGDISSDSYDPGRGRESYLLRKTCLDFTLIAKSLLTLLSREHLLSMRSRSPLLLRHRLDASLIVLLMALAFDGLMTLLACDRLDSLVRYRRLDGLADFSVGSPTAAAANSAFPGLGGVLVAIIGVTQFFAVADGRVLAGGALVGVPRIAVAVRRPADSSVYDTERERDTNMRFLAASATLRAACMMKDWGLKGEWGGVGEYKLEGVG